MEHLGEIPWKKLWRAALFAAGFFLIFAGLTFYYRERISKNHNLSFLLNRFREEETNPELVFLGDSHPAIDIKSEFLPRRFHNFSYPGENWRSMSLRARLAMAEKKDLKFLVIPLDYHLFSVYRARDEYFTDFLPFFQLEDIRDIYRPSGVTLFKARVSAILPLVSPGNRQRLRKVTGEDLTALLAGTENEKAIAIDEYGGLFHTQERVWPEVPSWQKKEDLKDRIEKHFLAPVVDQRLVGVFDEFLRRAEVRGIKVIGVRFPLSNDYQAAAPEGGRAEVEEVYAQKKFFGVLDYRNLFSGHEEYFTDPDHLNSEGGNVFTKVLVKDLQSLIARGGQIPPRPVNLYEKTENSFCRPFRAFLPLRQEYCIFALRPRGAGAGAGGQALDAR